MPLLAPDQITERLATLPGWQLKPGGQTPDQTPELTREFAFADFVAAMHFVNNVAAAAEQSGHHPDIDIRYNKVRLALSTHDAGGITEKDTALAAAVSTLV